MLEIASESGLIGYVIQFIGVACLVFIFKGLSFRADKGRIAGTRRALLFWGVLSLALGFLGHTMGIFQALSVMADASEIKGADVAEVMRISMGPVILGFIVLAIAAAGWMVLGRNAEKTA